MENDDEHAIQLFLWQKEYAYLSEGAELICVIHSLSVWSPHKSADLNA
jgi:hypothetical protein